MSDRDKAVRKLAEEIADDRLRATGAQNPHHELWAGHRSRLVRQYKDRLIAFLAEREAEALRLPDEVVEDPKWRGREQEALRWLYRGGDVDDLEPIRGTLAAMLQERVNSENRAIQEKWRALGEGAGLLGALAEDVPGNVRDLIGAWANEDPSDLGHRRASEIEALMDQALTSSPTSERAGALVRLVVADRESALAGGRSRRQAIRDRTDIDEAVDALRDELAKGGER